MEWPPEWMKNVRKGLGLPPITVKTVADKLGANKVGEKIGEYVDGALDAIGSGASPREAITTAANGAVGDAKNEIQAATNAAKVYLQVRGALSDFFGTPIPWIILAVVVTRKLAKK